MTLGFLLSLLGGWFCLPGRAPKPISGSEIRELKEAWALGLRRGCSAPASSNSSLAKGGVSCSQGM